MSVFVRSHTYRSIWSSLRVKLCGNFQASLVSFLRVMRANVSVLHMTGVHESMGERDWSGQCISGRWSQCFSPSLHHKTVTDIFNLITSGIIIFMLYLHRMVATPTIIKISTIFQPSSFTCSVLKSEF